MPRSLETIELTPADVHVHDRGKTQGYKATPASESEAALSGGFTTILAMPNTEPPVVDEKSLDDKLREAMCGVDVYYGAYVAGVNDNQEQAAEVASRVAGLKLYMNNTTGDLLIDDINQLQKHFCYWPGRKPICVHAEGKTLQTAIELAQTYDKKLHVCHVSTKEEILMVRDAKERGLPVTCEVTPHHLLLTQDDLSWLGNLGLVKPNLATQEDQNALWQNLNDGVIDCIATDHAPHLLSEKLSDTPPYGMPGLETALPLMLQAVAEKRLTMERLVEMISANPQKIFGLSLNTKSTYAVIEIGQPYYLDQANLRTKCGWSPFTAHKLTGKVRKVFVGGELVFNDGEIIHTVKRRSNILFQN